MAKGQQRGNREAKKPKQAKTTSSAPSAPTAPGQSKGYVFAPGKKK
jgi:hypothetical protein